MLTMLLHPKQIIFNLFAHYKFITQIVQICILLSVQFEMSFFFTSGQGESCEDRLNLEHNIQP